MRFAYLMLVVALLVAFAGSASAFEMVLSVDNIAVHTGETKTIELAVVSAADDVVIFATPIEQPWMSMPTHLFVNASQQTSALLTFSPFDRTEPRLYTFLLALQSLKTGERRERNITVVVRSAQVAIEQMQITGELEPGGWGQLDIYVKNYESSPATVVLNVDVGDMMDYSTNVTLGAGEFTIVKRGFTIPECQAADEYMAHAELEFQGVSVFEADEPFVIPEKFIPIITKNETADAFKTDTVVTIKNVGNIAGTAEHAETLLGALFFSGDRPARTDDRFHWFLDLSACQTRTIHYQIDYTPIPVALFVIFALWYVFFRLRTVRIKKLILQKAVIEKGFEFTIGVDTKSWVNAKDIEIHDFVPSLFDVRDTPGIKPIKRKTEAGTELVWRFKEFRPYEEHIVDYKIVPLFGVSGQINLPRASTSFTYLGRRITKSSPSTTLGLKLVEQIERAGSVFEISDATLRKISAVLKRIIFGK